MIVSQYVSNCKPRGRVESFLIIIGLIVIFLILLMLYSFYLLLGVTVNSLNILIIYIYRSYVDYPILCDAKWNKYVYVDSEGNDMRTVDWPVFEPRYRHHKFNIINKFRRERFKAILILLFLPFLYYLATLPLFSKAFTSCYILGVIPLTDIEIEGEIARMRTKEEEQEEEEEEDSLEEITEEERAEWRRSDREYDKQLQREKKERYLEARKGVPKKGKIKLLGYYNNKSKMVLEASRLHIDNEVKDYWKYDLEKLFNCFTRNQHFRGFGKTKAVFVQGLNIYNKKDEEQPLARELGCLTPLHSTTVMITSKTTFEDYYNEILPYLNQYWDSGYEDILCHEFVVNVYNLDPLKGSSYTINKNGRVVKNSSRSYSTSVNTEEFVEMVDPSPVNFEDFVDFNLEDFVDPVNVKDFVDSVNVEDFVEPKPVAKVKKKPSIKPLKIKKSEPKNFATVDIETMILNKKTQVHVPVAISTYSKEFKKVFIIDHNLLKRNPSKAVKLLFKEYLDFMISLKKDYIIFAHNLGGYDGYFIYKEFITIVENLDDLNCLFDSGNKFISISLLNLEEEDNLSVLTWKDSLRIFPGSLDSICKQFNVEGKVSKYNPEYNTIELFDNLELFEEFKEYSMQDSIALYNALINAQKLYMDNYQIDICNIVSTASLAFKIFRSHHLTKEISLLTPYEETFVRESYLGGATDYYKALGENVYWYDINSLYPTAMLQPVPYKAIANHKDLSSVNVKDFKGFVLAKVTCPENIKHPIVSVKQDGKTIYPRGCWKGVYFADYLAKAQDFGYKIELISGIEFEYADLFSTYIEHFYEIKRTSKGSLKYLAKLKLNSLYGMFGRKNESVDTINIKNDELINYFATKVVKNVIDYNNGYSTVVCAKGVDLKKVSRMDISFDCENNPYAIPTLASVAIASAITSRAQMIMMDYKNNPDFEVLYTDTDSIFTNKPLPKHLVGDGLGQMKNETLDKFGVECIDKACFVGLKKYGLLVTDKDGNKHESSTFAGVPKDSLTFDEVVNIHNGEVIVRKLKDRFSKTFNSLTIKTQSNVTLTISNKRDKSLVDNNYIPITVNSDSDRGSESTDMVGKILKKHNSLTKKHTLTP
jgi:hypothetical protein